MNKTLTTGSSSCPGLQADSIADIQPLLVMVQQADVAATQWESESNLRNYPEQISIDTQLGKGRQR